jgi:hypothetical protein
MEQNASQEAGSFSSVKKFPIFYGIRDCTAVFTDP